MKILTDITKDCVDVLEVIEERGGCLKVSMSRLVNNQKLHGVTMRFSAMERRALKAAL